MNEQHPPADRPGELARDILAAGIADLADDIARASAELHQLADALGDDTGPDARDRVAARFLVARYHRTGDPGPVGELHRTGAWQAVEPASWGRFVRDHLGISRARSYQLLDLAAVRRVLGELDVGADAITEAQARPLAPYAKAPARLHALWLRAQELAGTDTPTGAQLQQAVDEREQTPACGMTGW